MASPQVHHLFHAPIADHSFSSDRQTLAVARENNVELYQSSGNKFTLSDELKGHEKTVTSVDIAPNSGRIVTCSQGTFILGNSPCELELIKSTIDKQTAMLMSGSRPPPAGNLPWSFSELTVPLLLSAGLPPSKSSPLALEPALLPSATSRRRTIGGFRNI